MSPHDAPSCKPDRILHTMLRVADLERSLRFYTEGLGMQLLRRRDYPSGRFTLAFVGYGPEETTAVLELTHNWDRQAYERGDAYGHVALAVRNLRSTCEHLARMGVPIPRGPGPMKGDPDELIAFVEDPDGYRIELIQRQGQ
jgi:lactoylglutathione lyase